MAAERGPDGRFLKGHTPIPGAHRPPGALNLVTRSLRERILDGFGKEDGVTQFVRDLKRDYPPAAAGLLARMLPPADEKPEGSGGVVTEVNILSIPYGAYLVGDPLRVATEEEARLLTGASEPLLIEHQLVEEVIAPPIEILEPEEQQVDKRDDGGVFVVRSSRLKARRSP
jgi:hypothetical protein